MNPVLRLIPGLLEDEDSIAMATLIGWKSVDLPDINGSEKEINFPLQLWNFCVLH
jgi:hypothetical protein